MNRAHHWYCAREAWKRHVREDLVRPALAIALRRRLGDSVDVVQGDATESASRSCISGQQVFLCGGNPRVEVLRPARAGRGPSSLPHR